MAISQRAMTLEEFLELPEEEPALEYEAGRITQKGPPKGKHSALQAEMAAWFNHVGRPGRRARAFTELRVTLGGLSWVPDVAVYLWGRIPRDESGEVANDFTVAPDILVEIVSPQQSVNALIRRCLWFVEQGTQAALLVDPLDRSVISFRPGPTLVVLHDREAIDLDPILPDCRLTVQELFDLLLV